MVFKRRNSIMNVNGLEQHERVEQAYKLIMQEGLSLRAASGAGWN